MKYKFWSVYIPNHNKKIRDDDYGGWLCIPPNKKYIPSNYPKKALVKKHNDELLPPPSYWVKPEFESIVYESSL